MKYIDRQRCYGSILVLTSNIPEVYEKKKNVKRTS